MLSVKLEKQNQQNGEIIILYYTILYIMYVYIHAGIYTHI